MAPDCEGFLLDCQPGKLRPDSESSAWRCKGTGVSAKPEGDSLLKIVSIVGARPQFVKAAAVSRVLRKRHQEVLVHTGQHYDYEMSGIFFDGLDLPRPDVNLAVGSGSHGAQTGAMLKGIEEVLLAERPDLLLIYGDTNSTLAGALAASKLSVPIAHVEAGLRSFNRRMPEEVNRVVADHLSDLLLCPGETAVRNLAAEGITRNVHLVGDVMLDVLNWAKEQLATKPSEILERLDVRPQRYLLATVHRSENTDDLGAASADSERLQYARRAGGLSSSSSSAQSDYRRMLPDRTSRSVDRSGRISGYGGADRSGAVGSDGLRRTAEGSLLAWRPLPHHAKRNGMGGNRGNRLEYAGRGRCRENHRSCALICAESRASGFVR